MQDQTIASHTQGFMQDQTIASHTQGFMQDQTIASHTCFGGHMDINVKPVY